MASTESFNSLYLQLADMQELSRKLTMPWTSTLQILAKQAKTMDLDTYSEVFKTYSTLADFYRVPASLDSSAFVRQDAGDGMKKREAKPISGSPKTKDAVSATETTREYDVNKINEQFRKYLESLTKDFIRTLTWVDFEDGMENEATRKVSQYMSQNRYVTYCWLNQIFNDNRTRPQVTSSILRTLAMVVNKNDVDIMLSIVTSGISSQHPEDQEAALMVIEKWRTKECLDAVLNTTFGSDWVKEYAMQIAAELKEELGV